MKANEILKSDFLDILFDDRNKDYGAYALRKNYTKRMWIALASTFITVFLAGWLLPSRAVAPVLEKFKISEVILQSVDVPEMAPPPPPPPITEEVLEQPKKPAELKVKRPQITSSKQKIKTTKFTPPVIKADKEVTSQEVPPADEIAVIDVISQDGVETSALIPNPPANGLNGSPQGKGSGVALIELPKEDDTRIFEKVEIEASVDRDQWRKHLERNLVRIIEDAAADGMPGGQYTVMVRFLVERDGRIGSATALNDPGFGLAKGAVQVVRSGPKWEPGIQNGRKVRSYHVQPITFVIMEA